MRGAGWVGVMRNSGYVMMGGTSRLVCEIGVGDGSEDFCDDLSFEGVSEDIDGCKCQLRVSKLA